MKKPTKALTHEEVSNAIIRFRARGGLIRKLPDEVVLPNAEVHCRHETDLAVAEPANVQVAGRDAA